MLKNIKAVIFDMDGVIINSEYLWRRVMQEGFISIGIPFTEEKALMTTGMRFKEVIAYWFHEYNITNVNPLDFNNLVMDNLANYIKKEGKPMEGVLETLQFLKTAGYQIALGTSSDIKIMDTVLDSLNIRMYFNVLCSAEFLDFGKPHPEVFLNCAKALKTNPKHCLVIEDSINGVIAAKAAQMNVIAIPEEHHKSNPRFVLADYRLESLREFIPNIKV